MNKKAIILTTSFVTITGFLILAQPTQAFWPFSSGSKNAQEEQKTPGSFPNIIQKLIDRFNLNPDEVSQVLQETREEQHQQAQANFENNLNEAVQSGKITEDQKNLILTKHEQMRTAKENWENLSPEERKEQGIDMKEDLKTWAEENGIDMKDLFLGYNKGHRGGFKTGYGLKNK